VCEKGFSGLKSSGSTDSGVTSRVLSTYLVFFQETKAPLYFVATCNSIENMPGELLRRFDDIFFVDLPDEQARREIFSIHLVKRKQDPKKFALEELSCASEGYSGDDIERIIQQAMLAALEQKRALKTKDILDALNERIPTLRLKGGEIEAMRDWAAKQGVRNASAGVKVTTEEKPRKRRVDIDPTLN